jgi:trimeric autotransporter adhesin
MTRQISVRFAVPVVCLLALAGAGTAHAQTLTVDTPTVNIAVPSGGFATAQVNLSTTSSTTVVVNTSNSPSWLSVNPTGPLNAFQNTPTPFTLIVNAAGLANGFTQTGTFMIGIQSSSLPPVTVTVNMTVGLASVLTANPQALSFTVPLGTTAANIPTQPVTISSSHQALSFGVSALTQDQTGWLIPFTTSGNSSSSPTINIGVNPGNLPPGVYHGTVYVLSTSTVDSTTIPVTMTVTAPATLSVTPTSIQPILFQTGTTPASGQLTRTVMVSSTNNSAGFTATANPVVPWLVVSPPNGATGSLGAAVPVTLTATPGAMQPGSYATQLVITPVGGAPLPGIPVTLVISNNPLLQLSTNVLNFTSNFAATTQPPIQTVQITTLGTGNTSFTATSDSSWLTATSATVTTPATLNVIVNTSGLAVGNYTGTITVKPTGADTNLYSLPITVNLTVGSTTTVVAGPPLLVFSVQAGQASPTAQLVQLTANGQPINFTIATSTVVAPNCPANWLAASSQTNSVSSTSPATLSVTPTTTGMTAGLCSGTVTIIYPPSGANQAMISIPVSVNVSATSLLTINMPLGFGQFVAAQNSAPFLSSITIGSTDGTQVPFTVTSSSNISPWLSVSANGPTSPQTLQVQIVPGVLTPNSYSGSITIASPSLASSPVTIPLTLTITSNATVTLTPPGPLNFAQALGGPVPAAQAITLTSSGTGASFQASIPATAACSWLQVSPTSGVAAGTVTFTPQANSLPQSVYTCPVTFSFVGSASAPAVVNAVLTVGPSQTITANVPSLSFAYQVGGTTPIAQQLTISSTGGSANFTVGTTSTGGWLTTDAGTATLATPKTINVTIIPANIPANAAGTTLQGSIVITSPGILATPLTVPVSLTVAAPLTPTPVSIFNSATGALGNGIAPGELITIKGINLGPDSPAAGTSFTVTPQGTISDTLVGVKVSFSGINGTPTYVNATQINVVVPWEVAGRSSVSMVVSLNGVLSQAIALNVVSIAPGVYTLNATGQGQSAALNFNPSGTVNGPVGGVPVVGGTIPTSPAVQGSFLAIYGTGGGLTSPGGVTGTLNSSTVLMPFLNWVQGSSIVTVTVGGKPATVTFAGAAPTLITGVWQINLQLPTGLSSGPQVLDIAINGQHTQSNVTVAVQ